MNPTVLRDPEASRQQHVSVVILVGFRSGAPAISLQRSFSFSSVDEGEVTATLWDRAVSIQPRPAARSHHPGHAAGQPAEGELAPGSELGLPAGGAMVLQHLQCPFPAGVERLNADGVVVVAQKGPQGHTLTRCPLHHRRRQGFGIG